MVTNFWELEHKISYRAYSAFIIDISKIFASNGEFSGSDCAI